MAWRSPTHRSPPRFTDPLIPALLLVTARAFASPAAAPATPAAAPATPAAAPRATGSAAPATPSTATRATGSDAQRAVDELGAWVAGSGGKLGALVVDVASGAVLAASGEHVPLNPASNAKVVTAAAVLDELGPDYRFTTGVYGKLEGGVVGPLVLRGTGDPSLETDELWQLVSALYSQGVRKVDGVLVDQGRFDDEYVPPAFEQQPDEWAPFRAPVSAVSLERNAVTLNAAPGEPGKPATVWFEPPGFVDVKGTVDTTRAGNQGVRLTVTPSGDRLRGDVAGFIGNGSPRLRVTKRVDDPRAYAGYVLAELLRRTGITVTGKVGLGGKDVRARLAYLESAPLAVLSRELGKNSDNFYAETLLKTLGAERRGVPGKSKDGAAEITEWLRGLGALDPGTVIRNGSGLFDANRVSASTLVAVLRHAYRSPRLGPDFASQLAVGGVDGTLRARFKRLAAARSLRAKTGTLDRTVALSGYLLPSEGRPALAFSLIVDGTGNRPEARARIDRVVEVLASLASLGVKPGP